MHAIPSKFYIIYSQQTTICTTYKIIKLNLNTVRLAGLFKYLVIIWNYLKFVNVRIGNGIECGHLQGKYFFIKNNIGRHKCDYINLVINDIKYLIFFSVKLIQ